MPIIDRRNSSSDRNSINRKKFIERNKDVIKRQVDDAIHKRKFENAGNKKKVHIKKKDIVERHPQYDYESGNYDGVHTGNKKYKKGQKIKHESGEGEARGYDGEDEESIFDLYLSEEELRDIFLSDMELPNYIKQSLKKSTKLITKRAGYSKEGNPVKLDLKKTYETAIARKLASKAMANELGVENKKSLYLDETDLRYRYYNKQPVPNKQAVMILLQDVSGSVDENMRRMAKKLFTLLYWFLTGYYKQIELVYIIHTTQPEEVDFDKFMNCYRTGGTSITPAYQVIKDIIEERYPEKDWNIYLAQSTDGETDRPDAEEAVSILHHELLPKLQYMAYAEVTGGAWSNPMGLISMLFSSIIKKYKVLTDNPKLGMVVGLKEDREIYPALHKLFEKGK